MDLDTDLTGVEGREIGVVLDGIGQSAAQSPIQARPAESPQQDAPKGGLHRLTSRPPQAAWLLDIQQARLVLPALRHRIEESARARCVARSHRRSRVQRRADPGPEAKTRIAVESVAAKDDKATRLCSVSRMIGDGRIDMLTATRWLAVFRPEGACFALPARAMTGSTAAPNSQVVRRAQAQKRDGPAQTVAARRADMERDAVIQQNPTDDRIEPNV